LCREIIGASLSTIGLYIGGRDHTTILHACRKVENLMKDNQRIRKQVEAIQKELRSTLF